MEVHRHQCQACGARDVHNLVVRETEVPVTIYVQCAGCGGLVARYRLSEYYHHGKGIESFLQSLGPRQMESGRDLLQEFRAVQQSSIEGYEAALRVLKEAGKET